MQQNNRIKMITQKGAEKNKIVVEIAVFVVKFIVEIYNKKTPALLIDVTLITCLIDYLTF